MRAIITIGPQGVGKSTYSKKLESLDPTVKRVTKDDIRFMLFDTNRYGEMFDEVHDKFGDRLETIYWMTVDTILQQGLTVILDETHHTEAERKAALSRLKKTYPGIKVEAHFLYSNFERCWNRNNNRRPEQIVPRDIMWRFFQELVASFAGSLNPWKVIDKLAWENFDTQQYIYADKLLDN